MKPQTDPKQNTTPSQGGETKPRLPHEHDQSADSQETTTAENDATGRQAHEDVSRGLKDTDRGPVVDKVYRDQVRGPAGS